VVSRHAQTGDYGEDWDWEGLSESLLRTILLPIPVSGEEIEAMRVGDLTDRLKSAALDVYERKRKHLGEELMGRLERFATLKTIDEKWKEHLYEMDRLKEGIGLRAYGQKDPLLEYKQEAYRTFTEMLGRIDDEVLELVFKAQIQVEAPEALEARRREPVDMATVHEEAVGMGFAGDGEEPQQPQPARVGKKQPIKVDKKIGRNEPCPCGSGKKYKHCHGKQA